MNTPQEDLQFALDTLRDWVNAKEGRRFEFGKDNYSKGYWTCKLSNSTISYSEDNPRHAVNAALAGGVK